MLPVSSDGATTAPRPLLSNTVRTPTDKDCFRYEWHWGDATTAKTSPRIQRTERPHWASGDDSMFSKSLNFLA